MVAVVVARIVVPGRRPGSPRERVVFAIPGCRRGSGPDRAVGPVVPAAATGRGAVSRVVPAAVVPIASAAPLSPPPRRGGRSAPTRNLAGVLRRDDQRTVVEATVVEATVVEATVVEAIARGSLAEIVAAAPSSGPSSAAASRRRFPASAGRLGAAGFVSAPSAASAATPRRSSRAAVDASRGLVVPAAVASVVLVLVAPPVAAEAVVAFVAFAAAAAPSPLDASPRSDAPPARVGGEVAGQASRDDGDPRGTRVRGEEPGGPEDERPREGLHDDRAEGNDLTVFGIVKKV